MGTCAAGRVAATPIMVCCEFPPAHACAPLDRRGQRKLPCERPRERGEWAVTRGVARLGLFFPPLRHGGQGLLGGGELAIELGLADAAKEG